MHSKKFLFTMAAALLLCFFGNAQNQSFVPGASLAPSLTAFQNQKTVAGKSIFEVQATPQIMMPANEDRWRRLRTNGIILTSLGAACILAGTLMVASEVGDTNRSDSDGTRAGFGVMGIAGGITAVGGGVTMWAIGNNRLRKAREFSLQARGRALGFVYRF